MGMSMLVLRWMAGGGDARRWLSAVQGLAVGRSAPGRDCLTSWSVERAIDLQPQRRHYGCTMRRV